VTDRVSILALAIGIVAVLVMEAAIDHAGASRSVVFGVFQASAPVLVAGVVYIANSAARLRIVVTLAALPEGDYLSFTRLQDLIGLTPGNLITHLRKLDDAGYVRMEKTGSGTGGMTSVSLTHEGDQPGHIRRAAGPADQRLPA
jgi:DNA-binding transcriptional ArsR family regulator